MMDRDAMLKTIRGVYDARAKGDIDELMKAFHPKATFELVGDRTERDPADVRGTLSGFIEAFEFPKRDILDILVDGDRAAIHSRVKVRFVPTNTVFDTDLLDVFRFQDGMIIRLVEFADTARIESVMSL